MTVVNIDNIDAKLAQIRHARLEREGLIVASEPEPPKQPEWPTIDGAAYYGVAGEIVRTLEPHTEADSVGLLIQFLAAFGNLVGSSPYYQVESCRHRANLFTVQVGASAKGRKGTAGARVLAIAQVADETWAAERSASGLSSGEGLINAVRDPVTKWDAKEQCEVVVDPGILDKRLMVTEPEFAGALAVMERHGNTLSPNIRNVWDGHRLQSLTKNSPLKATGTHISIIAHITEAEARARLTRTDIANGFANRFLFCCVRRSKLLPHGGNLDDAEIARLGALVANAAAVARKIGRVRMTAPAAQAWEEAYRELSAERPGLVGAVIARAEAQVIRIALIYALLDCSVCDDTDAERAHIDVAHLEAAMAVWAYCEASAVRIFGDSLGDPLADDILAALRGRQERMTRTEIYNLLGRHRSSDQIAAALRMLLEAGRANFETVGTNGRPIERWFAVAGGRR
jgi:hypothetical protein